tara:strand:- start:287 stop:934 length:648 start_codon:yes stop_codon:yes gene_type:complete
MKELIEKEYKRFDLNVVPFGIDIKNFKPSHKKESKDFVVGTIKSIEEHNGIDCLIDAAKILIDSYSLDINFLIIGDGSLRHKMQQKTKKLKIDDKINFKGFVNHNNVVKYYNLISIFIAVSTRESFGVSVLEAAACQVPSITSNIGGLVEVNLHKKTGLVIKPEDPEALAKSIFKLYKNGTLRDSYGRNARERVEKNFNWTSNVNQMINIYKKYV